MGTHSTSSIQQGLSACCFSISASKIQYLQCLNIEIRVMMEFTRQWHIRSVVILVVLTSIIFIFVDRFGFISQGKTHVKSPDESVYESMLSAYKGQLKFLGKPSYKDNGFFLDTWETPDKNSSTKQLGYMKPKLILLWTPFFGEKNWLTDKSFSNCPVNQCVVTTNRDRLNVSDAVVMHARDMKEVDLPQQRSPFQRWTYFLMESPWHTGVKVSHFNGMFNWTVTYRHDSDFPRGYGRMKRRAIPLTTAQLDARLRVLSNKTKLVAARISNCNTMTTSRLRYVKELQKYISVDFYGQCGSLGKLHSGEELMKQYKFFLSFENSNCLDYITEKFWLPLSKFTAIPVVMGGASPSDYSAVAPNSSFIHVSGFRSAQALAEFLRLLDRNPALYRSYFMWHKHWEVNEEGWCQFCSMLNNNALQAKSYRDFLGWYNKDVCKVS